MIRIPVALPPARLATVVAIGPTRGAVWLAEGLLAPGDRGDPLLDQTWQWLSRDRYFQGFTPRVGDIVVRREGAATARGPWPSIHYHFLRRTP